MRHYTPDKNCLTTLRIIILSVVIVLLAAIRLFIPVRSIEIIASSVISLIALIIMLIYLPLYFSSVKYTVTDSEIIRSSGVFIKYHQSVRYSSIQYATSVTTPLSSYTGLNFIIFFVYGGQLRLSFLNYLDAQEILLLSGSVSGKEG